MNQLMNPIKNAIKNSINRVLQRVLKRVLSRVLSRVLCRVLGIVLLRANLAEGRKSGIRTWILRHFSQGKTIKKDISRYVSTLGRCWRRLKIGLFCEECFEIYVRIFFVEKIYFDNIFRLFILGKVFRCSF